MSTILNWSIVYRRITVWKLLLSFELLRWAPASTPFMKCLWRLFLRTVDCFRWNDFRRSPRGWKNTMLSVKHVSIQMHLKAPLNTANVTLNIWLETTGYKQSDVVVYVCLLKWIFSCSLDWSRVHVFTSDVCLLHVAQLSNRDFKLSRDWLRGWSYCYTVYRMILCRVMLWHTE